MAAPTSAQIVDDFENSFQACLAALTNPDYNNVRDSEEIKTGVEQTIQRFLDVAKQMECFFLQKRLLLSVQKPEHIILENISELKNELARKEQLLNKYYDKIQFWQSLLQDVPGTPRPPQPSAVPTQPPQSMSNMPGPPGPSVVAQQGMPQSHPHHMMQPHCGPPMTSSPVPGNIPSAMVLQNPQMHPPPPPHMAPNQQPGALQGPLAYLERTMSNIGMPEPGR